MDGPRPGCFRCRTKDPRDQNAFAAQMACGNVVQFAQTIGSAPIASVGGLCLQDPDISARPVQLEPFDGEVKTRLVFGSESLELEQHWIVDQLNVMFANALRDAPVAGAGDED